MKIVIPFFISQAVTLFGNQIVAFALVWNITLQTGSGLWVALLSICSFVPQFLMSFVGGALADRVAKNSAPSAAAPKIFFRYYYVNSSTGEKSGVMLADVTWTACD